MAQGSQSRRQVALCTVPAILLTGMVMFCCWVAREGAAHAQGTTIILRPTSYSPGASLGSPQNAYDASDSTTAGSSISHVCHTNCTTITTDTATWLGILDLIRFGGRVNYVDLVSSSFVEESLQVLGRIGISIRRSLVAAGERPVAI